MSITYTVKDNKGNKEIYHNIRRMSSASMRTEPNEEVVIVADEDDLAIWVVAPGGFSELLKYYQNEAPHVVEQGVIQCTRLRHV